MTPKAPPSWRTKLIVPVACPRSAGGNAETAPYLFASISVCEQRLFNGSPEGPFSLLKLWNRAEAAGRLYGLVHDGDWFHVGTPAALADAERVLA